MSINVIITFQAKPDNASAFAVVLGQVKHDLPKVAGCKAVRLFGRNDNSCIFTLIEEWESGMQHKAHIANVVSSGAWAGIAAHLASDPVSHYYTEL